MERTTLLHNDGGGTRPLHWRATREALGRSGEVVGLIFPLLFEAMGQWTSQGRVMVKAIFWAQCELCFEFWQLLHPIFELPIVRRYSNTHKMNHIIPILNILMKKSNHQKIQEHAPSEFLCQASYVFAGELVAAAYNIRITIEAFRISC